MRKFLIAAALFGALPCSCLAAELSYTYVEAGYTALDLDTSDDIAHGGYVRGSWQITEPVYLFAGFFQVRNTLHNTDYAPITPNLRAEITLSQPEIGIGYRLELSEHIDFIANASFSQIEQRVKLSGYDPAFGEGVDGSYTQRSSAMRGDIGIRGKPSPRTEGWVKLSYVNGGDVDGHTIATLGGQVNITPTWGLVGEFQHLDGNAQGLLGVRASF